MKMTQKSVFSDNVEGKDWLKGLLHFGLVTVTFTKKDGSEREMVCTLDSARIPEEKLPKGSTRTKSEESLAVFDVEKEEWRSFRWDSIVTIRFNIDGEQCA
jgi:hypothetical protein